MAREKVIVNPTKIIDAAYEIIDTRGFGDFSSRKLAASLGVSHMTVYNYFDRDEVLGQVITRGFQQIHNLMDDEIMNHLEAGKEPVEVYLILANKLVQFAKTHKSLYIFMFTKQSTITARQPEVKRHYYSAEELLTQYLPAEVHSDFRKDSNLFFLIINAIILGYLDGRHNATEESCRSDIERSYHKLLGAYRIK